MRRRALGRRLALGSWGVVLALAFGLRVYNAGADLPLWLSRSNAEITDAAWYLGARAAG